MRQISLLVIAAVMAWQPAAAEDILEFLKKGSMTLQYTDCHVKQPKSFTIMTAQIAIRGESLVLKGSGVPGQYDPYTLTKQFTASGNRLSWDTDVVSLSDDGVQCSYQMVCPGTHPVGHAVSCSVNSAGGQQTVQAPATQDTTTRSVARRSTTEQPAKKSRATSDADYCAQANSVERSSAYWGYMCVPEKRAAKLTADKARATANSARNNNPSAAAEAFRQAADAYRIAGDIEQADAATRAADEQIVASLANPLSQPATGTSRNPDTVQPSASPFPYKPTITKQDCTTASPMDRETYAYYLICVPGAIPGTAPARGYESNIKPPDLSQRADASCMNAQPEDRRRCAEDFKVALLLKDEPNVRDQCTQAKTQGRDALIECVDRVYLYGPHVKRRPLIKSLGGGGTSPESAMPAVESPLPAIAATAASDPVQAFEQTVTRVAELVVAGLSDSPVTNALPAEDRKACLDETYAAVRRALKGGPSPMSDKCRDMITTAYGELAYYTDWHVDRRNSGVEEVFAGYLGQSDPKSDSSLGGKLGSALPGMAGLRPDAANRRANDCADAAAHWKSAEEIKTLPVYEDHLRQFPNCTFATLAKARIEALQKQK